MATRFRCPSCGIPIKLPQHYPLYCRCGFVVTSGEVIERQPVLPVLIAGGPGTELMEIMTELGIKEKPNCTCRATAKKMDQLGVDGCEQQRDWIVKQIETNAAKWSWLELMQIVAGNVTNPLALAIAFRGNIYHALLDEAIARAKRKENKFPE